MIGLNLIEMEKSTLKNLNLRITLLDKSKKIYCVNEDDLVDSLLEKIGSEINISGDELRLVSEKNNFYRVKHLSHDFKSYHILDEDDLQIEYRIWTGHVTYVDFSNKAIDKIKIETCTTDKVSYLMKLIKIKTGMEENFKIVYAGKVLSPERSLADYCVQTESIVHCVFINKTLS